MSSSTSSLDDWALRLSDAIGRSASVRANETELREDVHSVIQYAAADLYGLDDLSTTGERPAGGAARRAYDRAYGGLIVEWEWDMGASRRRAGAGQALEYLELLRHSHGSDSYFTAVVCDGKQWGFLVSDTPAGQLALDDQVDLMPEQKFEWRPNNQAACRRFLSLIGSNRQKPLTAGALAAEFGPGSDVTRSATTLLLEALTARVQNDRADTLFKEWRRSLEVVYDNFDDNNGRLAEVLKDAYGLRANRPLSEILFGVHTFFALVARLVAIEVLAVSVHDRESQPSLWTTLGDVELQDRLRAIDAGEIPERLHVQNLFEGDLFSWYVDALMGNSDLLNTIRDLLDRIGGFAFPRLAFGANPARDVLRDLYHDLLPRDLRKALGEFLTPVWLAESCIDRLRQLGADIANDRVVDPTCGTATFLMPLLMHRLADLRATSGQDVTEVQVQGVLDSVVGFDLNPVAVIAARVNYVVALGDLAAVGDLTLPIWRADSILLPDAPTNQTSLEDGALSGHPWQELRTSLEEPFPVPPKLANSRCMPLLRRILEESLEEDDRELGRDHFANALERYFGLSAVSPAVENAADWDDVREVAIVLYERVRQLADDQRDGVWASHIENSFAPLFAGRFNIVIGNPPWLAWNKLPAAWRSAGEVHWKRYGLWRPPPEAGERPLQPQIGDVATLVYATAVDRYAADGALVGLLVPKSLLIGDPGGRAFRQFHLAAAAEDRAIVGDGPSVDFSPVHADDWSAISPFAPEASNQPVFLVTRVGKKAAYPVATAQWKRASHGARLGPSWTRTQSSVQETSGLSSPIDPGVPTSAWSFVPTGTTLIGGGTNTWQFGLGLNTRGANGIYFVDVLSRRPNSEGRIQIVNDPANGRNSAVRARRGLVEAALVYPLLRGKDVQPWHARPSTHIIVPYRQETMGSVIAQKDLRNDFSHAYRWLRSFRPILKERRIIATLNWDMDGDDYCQVMGPLEFMDGRPLVVVREIAKHPAAAVVTPSLDTALGRTATTLADHKLVFCRVEDLDEAHYLAAMINSQSIQNLLASFASQVGLAPGTLARLPIPPYNGGVHAPIVAAAKAAAGAAANGDLAALADAQATVDASTLALLTK